jgi:hypothetical protein
MPVIPAGGKLRQEEQKSEANLSYIMRPCAKKKKKKKARFGGFTPVILATQEVETGKIAVRG